MKRLLFLAVAAMVCSGLSARQHVIEIIGDAGYTATANQIAHSRTFGGLGYGGSLGYAYFFHPNIGFGVGVGCRHYGMGAQVDYTYQWKDVFDTDTPAEQYTHMVKLNQWKEQVDVYYLEVPVSVQFRFLIASRTQLLLCIGASYAMPLYSKTKNSGQLTHMGDYPQWGLMLDIPEHGFYTNTDFHPSTSLKMRHTVAPFARIDFAINLTEGLQFLAGARLGLAALPILNGGTNDLGFRNDIPNGAEFHSFMNDYTSLYNTSENPYATYPFHVSLEIGLRYHFKPYETKYPCHCLEGHQPAQYRRLQRSYF